MAVLLKGAISQLSEQISTLNDRMDEFTSRIDELSSQLSRRFDYGSQSQQKLESSNGSTSTSCFTSNGSTVRHSSLTQLPKDSPINEEVIIIYVLLKIDV